MPHFTPCRFKATAQIVLLGLCLLWGIAQAGDTGGAVVDVHALTDPPAAVPVPEVVASAAAQPRGCGPDYRYKALVASFPVRSPVQLSDVPRFPQMLQSEIARRMAQAGHFLPQISGNEAAYAVQPGQSESQWNPEWIRDLARRYGVQFVVGGALLDAGVEGERYALTYGSDIRPGERKQEFNFPLLDFFKPGIKATPSARRFEMDILIFDGISGAQIGQHRIAGKAEGTILSGAEVVLDPDMGAETQRFFASDFGRLVNNKLDDAVRDIGNDVQCAPFSARVIRVAPGRIYLDAGSSSKLAIGDRLQVLHVLPGATPLQTVGRSVALGWPTETVGTLIVRQVQPLFAMAEPEGRFLVETGDFVSPFIPAHAMAKP